MRAFPAERVSMAGSWQTKLIPAFSVHRNNSPDTEKLRLLLGIQYAGSFNFSGDNQIAFWSSATLGATFRQEMLRPASGSGGMS
jgi:hypothetical protein